MVNAETQMAADFAAGPQRAIRGGPLDIGGVGAPCAHSLPDYGDSLSAKDFLPPGDALIFFSRTRWRVEAVFDRSGACE